MKKNKKIKTQASVALVTVATSTIIGAGSPLMASATSITEAPNFVSSSTIKNISNEYSFICKWIDGKTTAETFGDGWYQTDKTADDANTKAYTIENPSDDKKGKIGMLYKNVGTYKGQNVNLRVTVKDWKKYYKNDTAKISLLRESIGTDTIGYEDVTYDWEYVADDGKPIDMSGAYITFSDIDAWQYIGFDEETSKNIEQKIYEDGTILEYDHNNGLEKVKASSDGKNYDNEDKRTMMTVLYKGNKLTFHWGIDPSHRNHNRVVPHDRGGVEHLGYTARKLARTEPLEPTKQVSDSDESKVDNNTLVNQNEEYTYDIYHTVPGEFKDFYYKSYEIKDEIPDVLDIHEIKVFDEGDNDVTDWFDVKNDGNKISAVAKNTGDANFYNHTYRVNVKVSVKDGADLSKYMVDGKIKLPNKATVVIDGEEKSSNEVNTTFEQINPEVKKSIVDNGTMTDHEDLSYKNMIATYRLDNVVPNKHMSSLILSDDLEDVLELANTDNIKVYMSDINKEEAKSKEKSKSKAKSTKANEAVEDSELTGDAVNIGEDVTAEGDLAIEGNKVTWTAKDPNKFAGKKLSLVIQAKVKDGADTSKYENDGKVNIPNKSQLIVDDNTIDSNEVTVTPAPKPTEAQVQKTLVDDGKDVQHEDFDKEDNIATYKLENIIPKDKELTSVVIKDTLEEVLELVNTDDIKVYMSDVDSNSKDESEEYKQDSTDSSKSEETTESSTVEAKAKKAKKAKSKDVSSLVQEVTDINNKVKDSDNSVDQIISSQSSMVLRTLSEVENSNTKNIDSNIKIIEGALNNETTMNNASDEQKATMNRLLEILKSLKGESSTTETTGKEESEKGDSSESTSSTDSDKEAEEELSKVDIQGEDVTDQFNIKVEGNTVTAEAKEPQKFEGKKLTLVLQAKVKEGADTSKYEIDGKVNIPNKSQLIINGESVDSNEVTVTPETLETPETPQKSEAPQTPTQSTEAPKEEAKKYVGTLPQTGSNSIWKTLGISSLVAGVAGLFTAFILKRRTNK